MIKRQLYLDQIIPLIDKPLIKVLTGVRRAGKTVLLSQIRDHLLERGIRKEQILYVSLESKMNASLKNGDTLYRHLLTQAEAAKGKAYILLDEIQMTERWEEVVSSLLVDIPCDIYITGSNSSLLSGELATLIAGRYVQIRVYPFSLSEAKKIMIENGRYTTDEALFADYLKYGGLPMRFALDDHSVEAYLSDTFDGIVTKDVVNRNKIKNVSLLNVLLSFLMDNVANTFSARSIVESLASNGIHTTVETILSYIGFLQNAMILYAAQRYDVKGKKLLANKDKYYAVDLGLRNVIRSSDEIDYSKLYENLVYLKLLSDGYEVRVGKSDEYEIDFIAYKGKARSYYQVCYALSSEKTVEREFGNLERVKDNYPKYVISGDIVDFSRNGIIHANIIKFLLGE